MNCPSCKETVLQMTERSGIEIDYCPSCRGVWLDRGELDKIIEKSNQNLAPESKSSFSASQVHDRDRSYEYKHKRKKSFLEEIFD